MLMLLIFLCRFSCSRKVPSFTVHMATFWTKTNKKRTEIDD